MLLIIQPSAFTWWSRSVCF